MELKRGQKVDITKNNASKTFRFRIQWQQPQKEMEVDISAFLLHPGDRCLKDEHFIFYGQPQSVGGAVSYGSINPTEGMVEIAFPKIPADIEKIALTLTIHEGDEQDLRFRDIEGAKLFIEDVQTHQLLHRFSFKGELEQETAIVIGELYRHNGEWKFNAVGSGFFGGLTALCENFGLQVADDAPQQETTAPTSSSMEELSAPITSVEKEQAPPITAVQQQAETTESAPFAITLEKGQSVSIQKSLKVVAALEWANPQKELDLYCFYVLQTGEVGKVYYRHLGSSSSAPYITLDEASKTMGMEKIIIHQPSKLKYVLFAANRVGSNGFGSFKRMKVRIVVDNQTGQRVASGLYESNWFAYWVAIAQIDFTKSDEMVISQVERYSHGGSEKSPVLYEDGAFEMDKGPIEIKK